MNPLMLFFLLGILSLTSFSCSTEDEGTCNLPSDIQLLTEFTNPQGMTVQIFNNGEAYNLNGNECTYIDRIFEPEFFNQNYINDDGIIYIRTEEDQLYLPYKDFFIDFENTKDFQDLFIAKLDDRDHVFTTFTLQSPSAPSVNEYVSLRKCILDKSCDFIDNSISVEQDPINPQNRVLQFYSVAPNEDMVTAKSSISTSALFAEAGDDIWYEANYFIVLGQPLTLVDFENGHFLGHPGPRVLFNRNHLVIENKFSEKLIYDQINSPGKIFPSGQWVKVKVYLKFGQENGILQLWQDDELIIDQQGKNIPLQNWVLSSLEIGISATSDESTLLVDDIRFSNTPF